MVNRRRLKIVEASGSYSNMGKKLGASCKQELKGMLADAKDGVKRRSLDWSKVIANAGKHVPYVEDYNPEYLEFIRSYSEAAKVPFDEIFYLFCLDEVGQCTDIAVNGDVTADGSVYSAHSEDWTPSSEEQLVLIKCKPKTGPRFMVMSMGGLEWISGINSAGISLTGNSLYMNDMRIGIPKLMMAPKILGSTRIGEALEHATPSARASSYNHNICHSSGEMYSVEASATDFGLLYPVDGYLVHANHFLTPDMHRYENAFGPVGSRTMYQSSSTIVRYHRALRLIRSQLGNVTIESLASILGDHVNRPASICRHPVTTEPKHDWSKTTFAVIFDTTKLRMLLCMGNPCEGEYKEYKL